MLNSDIKVALANGDVGVVVVDELWPLLFELVLVVVVPLKPNKLLPELTGPVAGFCSVILSVNLSPPFSASSVLSKL